MTLSSGMCRDDGPPELPDDWRLDREEEWMYGAVLERRAYSAPTEDWTHDHCLLCWAKLTEDQSDDNLHEGYVYGYDRTKPMPPLEERREVHPDAPADFRVS